MENSKYGKGGAKMKWVKNCIKFQFHEQIIKNKRGMVNKGHNNVHDGFKR